MEKQSAASAYRLSDAELEAVEQSALVAGDEAVQALVDEVRARRKHAPTRDAERLRVLLFESDSVAWQNGECLQEAQALFERIVAALPGLEEETRQAHAEEAGATERMKEAEARATAAEAEVKAVEDALWKRGMACQYPGRPAVEVAAALDNLQRHLDARPTPASDETPASEHPDTADAQAFRRAKDLLEDPRGVEGVFWDALREEAPLVAEQLSGKDMEAVEEALGAAIRWTLNIDGASAHVDLEADDEPTAVVECPPCSTAGGADRGVFHKAPPCPPPQSRTTSRIQPLVLATEVVATETPGEFVITVPEQDTRETGGEGVRSTPLRDLSTGPGRKGGQLCPPTVREAFERLKSEGVIPADATDPHAGPMGSIGYVVTRTCPCGTAGCEGNCQG